jgi:hypothetical protein
MPLLPLWAFMADYRVNPGVSKALSSIIIHFFVSLLKVSSIPTGVCNSNDRTDLFIKCCVVCIEFQNCFPVY